MKILIDTHIAVWAILDKEELSSQAKDIILDPSNLIYYAQAKAENIMFLTHDSKMTFYNEPCVLCI